jgi:Flp pilus assembly protein TadB
MAQPKKFAAAGAGDTDADRRQARRAAADLVRQAAEQQKRHKVPQHVDRIDERQRDRRKSKGLAEKRIKRRRQDGADEHHREHARDACCCDIILVLHHGIAHCHIYMSFVTLFFHQKSRRAS